MNTKGLVVAIALLCILSLIFGIQQSVSVQNTMAHPDIICPEVDQANLLQRIEELENELKQSKQTPLNISTPDLSSKAEERQLKDVCHPLPAILPAATTIWRDHLKDILEASMVVIMNGEGEREHFESWFELMLDHLTPVQLLKSVKTLPNMTHLRRVIEILQARHQHFLRTQSRFTGRKLKILVFGGSVTAGVLCRSHPMDFKLSPPRRRCSWTYRLEYLINELLGYNAVEILNESLGGTNSENGAIRINYDLLPDNMPDPDIIINAYSSNDMHVLSMLNAQAKNLTLTQSVFDLTQNFIRSVEGSRKCDDNHRPLLIYLDEYLGNEQDGIMDTMAFSSALHTLANYYGIMSISYSDAVRHIVYANTKETWFSANWYDQGNSYVRQIHQGLGGHVSIMWTIAFNLLNAVTVFCNEEAANIRREPFIQPITYLDKFNSDVGEERVYMYKGEEGMPEVKFIERLKEWPAPIPIGIIPELTPELKLQNISSLWRESTERYMSTCGTVSNEKNRFYTPCTFTWIASVKEVETVETLNARMNEVVIQNDGWNAELDHNKLGYVPTGGIGSSFVMEKKNIMEPIKTIHLMTMKSYGERWNDSRIIVTVIKGEDEVIGEMEIEGFHQSETSVTYNHLIELNSTNVGDNIKVSVKLIGGSTFKFTGMSFCSR